MGLVKLFKEMFLRKNSSHELEQVTIEETSELFEAENIANEVQVFDTENAIFNKLEYMKQYIKIFSLTFPDKYEDYLTKIEELKLAYQEELQRFQNGLSGNIAFSVDPEYESKRYVEVIALEDEIKRFIDIEVEFKDCKDKFSKLCYKLNLYYNALIDTNLEREKSVNQLYNAYGALEKLVADLRQREFFKKDTRKKDELLNYVVYCDYVSFKSSVRLGLVADFNEYKQRFSEIYSFFAEEYYEKLIFKFLIESLEEIQKLVVSNLASNSMYEHVLKETQALELLLDGFKEVVTNCEFFQRVVKLENTVCAMAKQLSVDCTIDVSKQIVYNQAQNHIISINNVASSILALVNNPKSDFLKQVIANFKQEISWREFYFLCKIFDLNNDIIKTADSTVFGMIKDKFLSLSEKYSEYSDEYILIQKKKMLSYCGSKSKKYILLLDLKERDVSQTALLLESLTLDFVIFEQAVYLNHSYFNGFKNLEANFGQETIF